jgi:hypothetical protein
MSDMVRLFRFYLDKHSTQTTYRQLGIVRILFQVFLNICQQGSLLEDQLFLVKAS